MADTARNLREENAALREQIEEIQRELQARKEAGQAHNPEPEMLYDPYDTDINPLRIKKHPEGLHLSWKNPIFRDQKGWKGWIPVTWDSEIGQKITEYVNDPPSQMEGTSTQDNYIRRGTDCILCYIDERIWNTRQHQRTVKAARRQQRATAAGNRTVQEGVRTYGDGATRTPSAKTYVKPIDVENPENPSHRIEGYLDEE